LEQGILRLPAKIGKVKVRIECHAKDPEKYAREKYFMHKPTEEVFIYRKKIKSIIKQKL
jgi:hypothetical protein